MTVAIPDATPPGWSIVLLGLLLAGLLLGGFWWVLDHIVRLAHEGGHALVAWLLGSDISSMSLFRKPRSGETWVSRQGWLHEVLVTASGYSAPPLFGASAAVLLRHGRADAVLWTTIVLAGLTLTVMATWFGRLVVVLLGLALWPFARAADRDLQLLAATTWAWVLLIGGLVQILWRGRDSGDYADLRRLTWIPRTLWFLLFTILSAVALVTGGMLLLGLMEPPV